MANLNHWLYCQLPLHCGARVELQAYHQLCEHTTPSIERRFPLSLSAASLCCRIALYSRCLAPKHLEELAWRLRNPLGCLDQCCLACLCRGLQVLLKHTCAPTT
jgi:hypothetical protein